MLMTYALAFEVDLVGPRGEGTLDGAAMGAVRVGPRELK